ncbi:MAG: 2-hydroxy-6-oxo-6-phenylhexa-2,4-dienoate hydrolase [Streptosporangiaceae bacterium]|nr:2-hydroxy-6-oxo-6-phenylhexa-2,4-dienoate hydrolase [Streptosporangiaceae bacterium]
MAGEEPDGGTAAGSGWAEFAAGWRRACATDRQLGILAAGAEVTFSVRCGGKRVAFRFGADRTSAAPGGPGDAEPEFTLEAPADAWALFFRRVPPPWYQSFFGMLMRVDGTQVVGNELGFAQHAHLVRRVLEIGRDTASGPAPEPSADIGPPPSGPTGRYLAAPIGGRPHRIYYEEAGVGRDLLMLHTAGADARQFHRLLADELLASRFRMVAFDLPWHGKSFPPAGAVPGDYRLSTDLYAETVMAVVEGLGLEQPIVLGASMAGEICLELAYRHPDRIGGVVACQASDHVPGRRVGWARHPKVNQALFVPEWVDGLMAPTSPPEYRSEVWWGYSQGGYAAFHGDIDFYSGDWDGTDRVPRIDTDRCPVVMLTGEYDYSCTPEMSRRTAAKIPGAVFRVMPRLGHFPYAENPPLFIPHLLDAIDSIDAIDTPTPHTEHTA